MQRHRSAPFVLASAICLLAVGAGRTVAGPADGMVLGLTKLVDAGPAADRFNLVLLGDGYQADDIADFHDHADQFVEFLFNTPPFSDACARSAINVWRIDVTSTDSGADDPAPPADDPMTPGVDESTFCSGGTGASVATYFDARFCGDGTNRRSLVANSATAIAVLNAQLPEWDNALIIVNSSIYGGTGGNPGVTSISGTWENIAIHEFGHSGFGLADEYEYWVGCPDEPGHDNHPAAEPAEANVTIETDPMLLKWGDLIAGTTPVPTTTNASCDMCDTQADPFPGAQTVGLYEGAHYYHCDAFRPVFSCMMRNFAPFCPVCTRRINQTLEPFFADGCECGDGVLGPREQCDDSNTDAGDCCDPQCQLDPSGTGCLDDGNGCTDDICDGAGSCEHPDNSLPCDDGDACSQLDVCEGGACVGGPSFIAATVARLGNDATLEADLTVSQGGGKAKLARRSFAASGTVVSADTVKLENRVSVWDVVDNTLDSNATSTIRGGATSPLSVPAVDPFCTLAPIACGGVDVTVSKGGSAGPLVPGVYGALVVHDGATVTLPDGTFVFCAVDAAKRARIETIGPGQTEIRVDGRMNLGNDTYLGPANAAVPAPQVDLEGDKIKVGRRAQLLAHVTAPGAALKLDNGTDYDGTICAGTLVASRRTKLTCTP